MKDITIIGGGLAGLVCSVQLAKRGFSIRLIEQKSYPFHRVCGEYISNEIVPFLQTNGLYPESLAPARIDRFLLTSEKGRKLEIPLDLGGFGISRYAFDHFLYQKAKELGVEFLLQSKAEQIKFENNHFKVTLRDHSQHTSRLLIGAHGKRSKIDKQLNRPFFHQKSPWVGVKYHIKADLPKNTVALHNFPAGYCGISKIEGELHNLCYLTHRQNLKKHGSVPAMEKEVLGKNPYLNEVFRQAEFITSKPLVINEISFRSKSTIQDHMLMVGDSSGMITPLCGNGMAMAIHGAKLLSETIINNYKPSGFDRQQLEKAYQAAWQRQFGKRLWYGRQIQKLFGSGLVAESAVMLSIGIKPLAHFLMKNTHGKLVEA